MFISEQLLISLIHPFWGGALRGDGSWLQRARVDEMDGQSDGGDGRTGSVVSGHGDEGHEVEHARTRLDKSGWWGRAGTAHHSPNRAPTGN